MDLESRLMSQMSRKPMHLNLIRLIDVDDANELLRFIGSKPETIKTLWPSSHKEMNETFIATRDFEVKPQNRWFLFRLNSKDYIVNTEDYNYMRYIGQIDD